MITRRRLLAGAAGAGLVAAAGCTGDRQDGGSARPGAELRACDEETGVVYGSSAATWQLSDAAYRRLFAREADILFTEDDLLWYRVRPTPEAEIDFSYADKIVRFAERNDMLVFGAHLVWDEGFGEGWTEEDLWGMDESTARRMLFGTLEQLVRRYRGRIDAWSVVNEAIGTDGSDGLRTDVPWYASLGPSYVAESFRRARDNDSDAVLVLNEFGFETVDDFGSDPVAKRRAALQVVDDLLAEDVPVDAFGVQGHLLADGFGDNFDPAGYRRFLGDLADRGLDVLITELDVLDDGLPPDPATRDRAIADVLRRYLDAALAEPSVKAVMTFGLSDRYTWLQEDYPRADGAPRRPLPFDIKLRPKPARRAVRTALDEAAPRCPLPGTRAASAAPAS